MKQNSYLMTQLSLKYLYADDVATLFGLADYYRNLTPAAIQAAAKKYLNPQNMVKVDAVPGEEERPRLTFGRRGEQVGPPRRTSCAPLHQPARACIPFPPIPIAAA